MPIKIIPSRSLGMDIFKSYHHNSQSARFKPTKRVAFNPEEDIALVNNTTFSEHQLTR